MKKIVVVTLALVLCSCNQTLEDKIIGKWNFKSIDSKLINDSSLRYSNSNKSLSTILGSSFFETNYIFFENHNHSNALLGAYSGVYLNGKWSINKNDSIISFTENKIKRPILKIYSISDRELKCNLIFEDKLISKKMEFIFEKEHQELKNSRFNYTQQHYNVWRKRPDEPENLNRISKRVKQSLEYSISYLKYSLEQKKKSVSLKEINFLPIDFYDNGIQLKDPNKIPKWESIFFSNVDALNGYEIIKQIIADDFSLPEDKTGLELNIYILEEIKNRIK